MSAQCFAIFVSREGDLLSERGGARGRSGRRPAHTNVFDNNANFRTSGKTPDGQPGSAWVTMPEHFKNSGWLTLGLGKGHTVCAGHPGHLQL